MKKALSLVLSLAMVFSLAACGGGSSGGGTSPAGESSSGGSDAPDEVYTLRFAHGSSTTEPIHAAAVYMQEQLAERSNGAIEVEIYPSATLADQVPAAEMMMDGTLALFGGSAVAVESFIDAFKIIDLPYLVSDYEEADLLFEGEVGEQLSAMLPDIGLYNLGWCEYGFRNTYNNVRPIETAEDLQGLKIRAIESPISVAMWTAFGADPTVMAWNEVYSGLSMGTVDGADGPNSLFQSGRMEEVVQYMSTTQHMYTPGVILASKSIMDSLPPDLWELVQEVGKEAADLMKETTRNAQEEAAQAMADNGLIINEVSPEVRAELAELCSGVYEENRDVIGAEFFDQVMETLGR